MNQIFISFGFLFILGAGGWKITSPSSSDEGQFDDINLTTPEIIQKYGYPAETHTAVTEDGYTIEIHRIPHGRKSSKPGIPILLNHCFLGDSSQFVLFGLNSLGFLLSDAGYDVWLGNLRGTAYTRLERSFGDRDSDFWNFSWHEMGIYDLPAQIDYICEYTQFENILYIGFSMGTTSYFVMASERPEYQKKIKAAFMLAPAAYLKHSSSPVRFLAPAILALTDSLTHAEFLPSRKIHEFCTWGPLQTNFCKTMVFHYGGNDPEEFNERGILNFLSHHPQSSSIKTVAHYVQHMFSGKFCQYDYGLIQNLARYNQSTPPEYNLEAITTPMSMFLGQNDMYVNPQDVYTLLSRISSVRTVDVVPYKGFTHMDVIVAKHAKELLYDKLMERIKEFLMQNYYPIAPLVN